jgi:glutamine synthetase
MYTLGEEKAKRLELRCPDPTANPYLALPAMLVYGISGVKGKLDADKNGFGPFEENIWEKKRVKQTPKSLTEALVALSRDKVLAETPVFPAELIESYVDAQMAIATEAQLYPTPADFEYYGDL